MTARPILLAAAGALALLAVASPAKADWDRYRGEGRHGEYRAHEWRAHEWRGEHRRFEGYGYGYYRPAPVYYARPRAYYAPPPVYYAPGDGW